MTREHTARWFFFALVVAATVLLAKVIAPIASPLLLAAVLAGILWPLQTRFSAKLGGRRSLSAGVLTFFVMLMLIGPLVALSAFVVREGSKGVRYVTETVRSEGVKGLIDDLPDSLQNAAEELIAHVSNDPDSSLEKQVSEQGGKASAAVGRAVSATGSLLFQTALMLIALYFLLTSGDSFVGWLDAASPLKPGQTKELLEGFKKVSYAVILSTVVTSAVQALAALAGYFIAQVPHPLFFGGVTFFVAFIPAIGAATVCIVAAGFLLVTGHSGMAIFLTAWGVVVVGLVDNVIKPLLIKRGMELHGAVVFFALIGGLAAFGPTGMLIGPMVVAFFLALVRMYQRDFVSEPVPAQGEVPDGPG